MSGRACGPSRFIGQMCCWPDECSRSIQGGPILFSTRCDGNVAARPVEAAPFLGSLPKSSTATAGHGPCRGVSPSRHLGRALPPPDAPLMRIFVLSGSRRDRQPRCLSRGPRLRSSRTVAAPRHPRHPWHPRHPRHPRTPALRHSGTPRAMRTHVPLRELSLHRGGFEHVVPR